MYCLKYVRESYRGEIVYGYNINKIMLYREADSLPQITLAQGTIHLQSMYHQNYSTLHLE